jgi:hypothetical protein
MLRLAIAGLVLTTTALAQEPPARPADPKMGRITGTVVADGGLPVAGAMVSLSGAITTLSDTQGAFTLANVEAGTHALSVSKPGLFQITQRGQTGTRQITVRAGENVRSVMLTLARGGVITGRIVDDLGEPVDQLQVSTMLWGRGIDGRRALMPTGTADLTDDHGRFRLFGLAPGDYAVVAVRLDPPQPGFAIVAGQGRLGPSELPIYFPGTRFPSDAQLVTIDAGREEMVNFTWERARALRVSGVVVSAIPLATPQIFLSTLNMSGPAGQLGAGGPAGQLGAGGSFTFQGVAPGDYVLTVRTGPAGGPFASVPVTVRDSDVSGLVVTMQPPARIRGRVTFDGAAPPAAQFPLRLRSNDPGDLTTFVIGDSVRLTEDGQFETQSGRSRVFFDVASGWSVTSVTVNGEDAYLTGIELSPGSTIDNVRVRVTNRLTRVSGQVTSDRGEPISGANVTVYQTDAPHAPIRMVLRTTRSDDDGRFEISGLRRGSYVAVASETADGANAGTEFEEWLRNVGQRFSLGEGQAVNLTLRPVIPR